MLEPGSSNCVLAAAARALYTLAGSDAQTSASVPTAGSIPDLVKLLGSDFQADAQAAATWALQILDANPDQNPAGTVPTLVQLHQLKAPGVPVDVQVAAVWALYALRAPDVENGAAISATGAIAALVPLVGHDTSADVKAAATRALRHLANSLAT
jgi:hypothetical protein